MVVWVVEKTHCVGSAKKQKITIFLDTETG